MSRWMLVEYDCIECAGSADDLARLVHIGTREEVERIRDDLARERRGMDHGWSVIQVPDDPDPSAVPRVTSA